MEKSAPLVGTDLWPCAPCEGLGPFPEAWWCLWLCRVGPGWVVIVKHDGGSWQTACTAVKPGCAPAAERAFPSTVFFKDLDFKIWTLTSVPGASAATACGCPGSDRSVLNLTDRNGRPDDSVHRKLLAPAYELRFLISNLQCSWDEMTNRTGQLWLNQGPCHVRCGGLGTCGLGRSDRGSTDRCPRGRAGPKHEKWA